MFHEKFGKLFQQEIFRKYKSLSQYLQAFIESHLYKQQTNSLFPTFFR